MAVSRRADTTSEGLLLEYVLMQNETSTRIQKALTNVPWLSASSQATRQYLASQSSLEQVAGHHGGVVWAPGDASAGADTRVFGVEHHQCTRQASCPPSAGAGEGFWPDTRAG